MEIQEYVDKFGYKIYDAVAKNDGNKLYINIGKLIHSLMDEFVEDAKKLIDGQTADNLIEEYNDKCNEIIGRMEVLYGPCPIKKDAFKLFVEKHTKENESNG